MKKNWLVVIILLISCVFCLGLGCNNNEKEQEQEENKILLNYHEKNLQLFESFTLRFPLQDECFWRSENPSIATVDENGYVVAVGFGTTEITVLSGEHTDSCRIIVENKNVIPKLELNVNGKTLSIIKSGTVADTFKLNGVIKFNGNEYTDGTYEYISSKPEVATVDNNGLITAVGFGSTDITVKCNWRLFDVTYTSETITINVLHDVSMNLSLENSVIYTENCTIDKTTYSNTTNLINNIKIDGSILQDLSNVTYTMTNDDIVSIDNLTTITALKYGETDISLTLAMGEDKYTSLPLHIEVKRPTINDNSIFLNNGNNDLVVSLSGNLQSCSIDGEILSSGVSGTGSEITISKSALTGIFGEKSLVIFTDKYEYVSKKIFATHSISNLTELQNYITNYTQDGSADDYVIITEDIDCEGYKFKTSNTRWFQGHVNGLGHAIMNYDANEYGLMGGRLVKTAMFENLALYFNVGSSNSVAIGNRSWNVGPDTPIYQNMYVKISGSSETKGLFTLGDEAQCYDIRNMIIDVSEANIEYAVNPAGLGTAKIKECYAIGTPTSGKVMNGESGKYTGNLSKTQSEMYADYATNITSANGFNEYWTVNDDGIYFGGKKVVNKNPIVVNELLYKKASDTLEISTLLESNVQKVRINGNEIDDFNNATVNFSNYKVGQTNNIEIIYSDRIVRIPFIVVTAIITSGSELQQLIMVEYYDGSDTNKNSVGDYVILGDDISLSTTSGKWNTNLCNNFSEMTFNGLGHKIDCSAITITGDGIFGDIRFTTIENVAIVNAKVNSGCPILASNAWGGATITNVYVESNYDGGTSVGLLLTGQANVKNCIVNNRGSVSSSGTNYALSNGCNIAVSNCFAISSNATISTNLMSNDNTKIYQSSGDFYRNSINEITEENGFNSYWRVKNEDLYFGENKIITEPLLDDLSNAGEDDLSWKQAWGK